MTCRVGTKINSVMKHMGFLKNGSKIKSLYEFYMNIDLFGTYFSLILDKIGLSVSQF